MFALTASVRMPESSGPPEWCFGLSSCATRDPGSSPSSVAAVCDRETHGEAHNWPSVVRVRGGFGRQGCPCPIAL